MPIVPRLESLLDDARSEVKRFGDDGVDLLHLALVASKRDPEKFAERFGPDGAVQVQAHLRAGKGRSPDVAATMAVLEGITGDDPVDALIDVLAERLGPTLAAADALPADPGAATPATADTPPAPPTVAPPTTPAAPTPPVADTPPTTATPATEGEAEPAAPTGPVIGARTAKYLQAVLPDPSVVGRDDVVDRILGLIGQRVPAAPLLVASAGAGRTTTVTALANRLADPAYTGSLAGAGVVRICPEEVLAGDRANAIRRILEDYEDVDNPPVLAFDDVEVIAALGGGGADRDLLGVIRAGVGDPHNRMVLLIDEAFVSRLGVNDEELADELTPIQLPPLDRDVLESIGAAAAASLAAHHGVTIPDEVARLALAPKGGADAVQQPGLLFARLDQACSLATLRADRTVTEPDMGLGRNPEIAPPDPDTLATELRQRVLGQEAVIAKVSARLALTRARLDLRPDRPDGVFLFIGPTGVGKTELARAICEALYGSEDEHLIRLDMSEYSHDWAVARLTGPQPGYVGYTEPEGWLTTRVRKQPESLVLLDEVEKAHPTVWNVFLQVFDAGRLSDARGLVADFSRVVLAMTSNIGADAFSAPAVGFRRGDDVATDSSRVIEQLKDIMPPELINRIDEVVVFTPLSPDAIHSIAEQEVSRVVERLRERGYALTVDPEVIDHLARTGYDPMYGARHLQRNVERLFLAPLATIAGRTLHAALVDATITWTPTT